eukprot:gene7054-7268_t
MSDSDAASASGSSFSGSAAASSIASDNTNTRALATLQSRGDDDGDSDEDLGNRKSLQEAVFAMLYTLNKDRTLDLSLRFAVIRVVIEYLQIFRAVFNTSFPWAIDTSSWMFKSIRWLLFKHLVKTHGYDTYISVFYFLAALVLSTVAIAAVVALILKGDESNNAWLKRFIRMLQVAGLLIYVIFWPAILDYCAFLLDCDWRGHDKATGEPNNHSWFKDKSCTAMPHLAHMLVAVVVVVVLGGTVLLMSVGAVDQNPLNRSWLSTSDGSTMFQILFIKVLLIIAGACLSYYPKVQAVLMFMAIYGATYLTLIQVYRFKDGRQVSLLCREMRRWDEDGIPDQEASKFGEFVIKCGMARMPSNPTLLVMYTSFLIETCKDGQAARTQLQLAQKANPSLLDSFDIYVAQQLAKQLRRDGDGMDLLGYVEMQRNFRSCVRAHKLALMAQRHFWNGLLRDSVAFEDMQRCVDRMESTEQRATSVYKRVLERYPKNGRLLKTYARFLEQVRGDPSTASKFYQEAAKIGTSESLLGLIANEEGASSMSAAGSIDEAVDGLIIINAQGIILMVNAAVFNMFGYGKGELEGKNVSVLMPQPFSSHHNQFLQRFVTTGVPHIVNMTRPMVALHKDRSMFPIMLCAMHLSGAGTEQLFIGVVRKLQPARDSTIQVFTSASGIMLCADGGFTDALGFSTKDLIGRSFSSICHDQDGVGKYLARATSEADGEETTFQTKLLHAFLPPVDMELSVEIGGALEKGSDYRTIRVLARVLSEQAPAFVLSHHGQVLFANQKFADMLGYTTTALARMDLNALLPQPFSSIHGAWFQDAHSMRPTPCGCRTGGVVYLLPSSGAKIPVTVKLSTKEVAATGHTHHIVEVHQVNEALRLDQRRLMLTTNHRGTVLDVNSGVQKSLFQFDATELVGHPVASVVDVFGLWRHKCQEDDTSLLSILAMHTIGGATTGTANAQSASWRVGVHLPVTSDIEQHAAQLAADGSQAKVCLHRADTLTTVLELDQSLRIAHADDAAGIIFGVDAKHLKRAPVLGLLGLPASTTFNDLLGPSGPAAKKGAMKTSAGANAASQMGTVKAITACHLGDGKPLSLELQAMSCRSGGNMQNLLRLRVLDPVSAGLQPMLALKQGKVADATTAMAQLAMTEDAANTNTMPASESSGQSADEDNGALLGSAEEEAVLPDNHTRPGTPPGRRLVDPPRSQRETAVYVTANKPGHFNTPMDEGIRWQTQRQQDESQWQMDTPRTPRKDGVINCPSSVLVGVVDAGDDDAASEARDDLSAAITAQTQAEEDLAVDAMRAKRLKKLSRMIQSTAAQSASTRWRQHSLLLLGLLFIAHLVGFAVVVTQINLRFKNARDVALMAYTIDRFLGITLRGAKMRFNIDMAHQGHLSLYLGDGDELQTFQDGRLLEFWTYSELLEQNYFPNGDQVQNATASLWHMGNEFIADAREVQYVLERWQATRDWNNVSTLSNAPSWQYLYRNGPGSMFKGYSWSLDTQVDFVWRDLERLSIILIVLLLVETVVVQLSCMVYEFVLVQQVNVAHMRLFSVFLALPSATVRFLAQQRMAVDDDDNKAELDDEDDIAIADTIAVPGAKKNAAAALDKPQKSVRVAEDVADDNSENDKFTKHQSSKHSPRRGRVVTKAAKREESNLTRHSNRLGKKLIGWLHPKFKYNGKKMVPSIHRVWTFMVPLLLWVAMVAIIFSISFDRLQGLQAPLAALDLSAHVLYRFSNCRLYSNSLAFYTSSDLKAQQRNLLLEQANVSFDPSAPAAAFSERQISNLFFKATNCLRQDQSTCYPPDSDLYAITHSGLDALVIAYIAQTIQFANLPDSLAYANHTSYDGLYRACDLFVSWTVGRFSSVVQLHTILLVISLLCMFLFVGLLYRPYAKRLHRDAKVVAGMLSQLPAEVDVESLVKTIVLHISKVNQGPESTVMQKPTDSGIGGSFMFSTRGPNQVPTGGSMMAQAVPGMLMPYGATESKMPGGWPLLKDSNGRLQPPPTSGMVNSGKAAYQQYSDSMSE